MVISRNMQEMVAGSSTIRKMFELGMELARKVGRENVFDFSLGNPAAPVPNEVRNSILNILATHDPNEIHGYMKNAGFDDVRDQVAAYLNQHHGTSYTRENIIMTVGAAGAINCILRSILEVEDEVLVFAPFFSEYRSYAGNYGGKTVVVPPDTENFQLDIDAAEKLITARTKAVIINNPNNPSGAIYTEETLQRLGAMLERAEQRVGHPLFVIADEPYRELVYDGRTVPYLPNIIRNTIFVYSFSKTISLPGERIGYIALSPQVDGYEELIQALVIANRCLGYVNAPSLFQLVAMDCLEVKAGLEFYDRNRRLLYEELTDLGFQCVHPDGAFYLLMKSPLESAEEFALAAEKENIILVPADSFGCPGYVRLAYCVSYDMIQRSIPAFQRLAAATLHRGDALLWQ